MFYRPIVPKGQESGQRSLVALLDLLNALEPELEAQPGLAPLWAGELRSELVTALGNIDAE